MEANTKDDSLVKIFWETGKTLSRLDARLKEVRHRKNEELHRYGVKGNILFCAFKDVRIVSKGNHYYDLYIDYKRRYQDYSSHVYERPVWLEDKIKQLDDEIEETLKDINKPMLIRLYMK